MTDQENAEHGASGTSNLLCAAFSRERNGWCVFKREDPMTMSYLWKCHTQKAAEKLAKAVNEGENICRGDKGFGTACGRCVKCELSI